MVFEDVGHFFEYLEQTEQSKGFSRFIAIFELKPKIKNLFPSIAAMILRVEIYYGNTFFSRIQLIFF